MSRLHLFTQNGQYINYKLGWTVNSCNLVAGYNGSIAVIDSSSVLTDQKSITLIINFHTLNNFKRTF